MIQVADRLPKESVGKQINSLLLYLFFSLFLTFLFAGCDRDSSETQVIQLDNLQPLPTLQAEQQTNTLKVAVAAILSPQGTIQSYQPFLRFLEKKTGKNIILIQRKTYQEVNNLLGRNAVDVAFVCTGAYREQREFMTLLAIPQINGKRTYRSLVIVSDSSKINSFQELRGMVFAFTDPLSNTGYRYPLTLLEKQGETPESYFSRTIFTYSHDRSINSVIDGVANGAAVDSIVYDFFRKRNPMIGAETRIVGKSCEYGMPPVVVPRAASGKQREWLREIFLQVHNDSEGRKALDIMGVDRFVAPDPELYKF